MLPSLTRLLAVGQSHGSRRVKDGDVKNSFHRRLVETREGFPGVGGVHLRGGDNPDGESELELELTS